MHAACRSSIPWRILFCGEEFAHGFDLTKAASLRRNGGIDVVQCARHQVLEQLPNADIAVPLMTTLRQEELMAGKSGKLKGIIQFGVGVEGIDVAVAKKMGIAVKNIDAGVSGNPYNGFSTAEHAIYLTLATLRQSRRMDEAVKNLKLGTPLGNTFHGKNVLIVGFGNVGKHYCRLARAFCPGKITVARPVFEVLLSDETVRVKRCFYTKR